MRGENAEVLKSGPNWFIVKHDESYVLRLGDKSQVQILQKGSHVTSWHNDEGVEQLYLSPDTSYAPSTAIRGGIPLCFPQFADCGLLPKHGFMRTSNEWVLDNYDYDLGTQSVWLSLKHTETEETKAHWPNRKFTVISRISLSHGGNQLTCDISVTNTNDTESLPPLQMCFHTYFTVSNIEEAQIKGLKGLSYQDKVDKTDNNEETRELVTIGQEVDRVYANAPNAVTLSDSAKKVKITKQNMADVVVWNPWIEKSKGMSDLPNDGYKHFVCIETGQINSPIILGPGKQVSFSQTVQLSPRSMLNSNKILAKADVSSVGRQLSSTMTSPLPLPQEEVRQVYHRFTNLEIDFNAFLAQLNSIPHQVDKNAVMRTAQTVLFRLCERHPTGTDMITMLDQIMKTPYSLTLKTFNMTLKKLTRSQYFNLTVSLYRRMKDMNLRPDRVTLNTMLNVAIITKNRGLTADLIQDLSTYQIQPDHITFTTLLNQVPRQSELQTLADLESFIEHLDIKLDTTMFNTIIAKLWSGTEASELHGVLDLMQMYKIAPNEVTFTAAIDVLSKSGAVEGAEGMIDRMVLSGLRPNVVTFTTLLQGYFGAQDLQKVHEVMQRMKDDDIEFNTVTYNVLMNGFASSGENRLENTLKIFNEMQSSGAAPNTITYHALIQAALASKEYGTSIQLFDEMKRNGLDANECVMQTLLDGLMKGGYSSQALHQLIKPESKALSAKCHRMLLSGFTKQGDLEQVNQVISLMKEQDIRLKECEVNHILHQLVSVQQWDEMEALLRSMNSLKLRITPQTLEHVVQHLCKNDMVPRALNLVTSLPLTKNVLSDLIYHVIRSNNAQYLSQVHQLAKDHRETVLSSYMLYKIMKRFDASNEPELTVNAFEWIRDEFPQSLDARIYGTAIYAVKEPAKALEYLHDMLGRSIVPSTSTCGSVLKKTLKHDCEEQKVSMLEELSNLEQRSNIKFSPSHARLLQSQFTV